MVCLILRCRKEAQIWLKQIKWDIFQKVENENVERSIRAVWELDNKK